MKKVINKKPSEFVPGLIAGIISTLIIGTLGMAVYDSFQSSDKQEQTEKQFTKDTLDLFFKNIDNLYSRVIKLEQINETKSSCKR